MFGTRSEYLPLGRSDPSSSSEDVVILDSLESAGSNERRRLRSVSRFTHLATVVVIICTIVDLLVLLSLNLQFYPSTPYGSGHIDLRSTYINLDVLYSKEDVKSSQHRPIINHASSFVQVSSAEPNKVLPRYHTGFYVHELGTVPFMERRLLVTPKISTVAQFRAIDFGMESCALAVHVPWLNETSGQLLSAPNLTLEAFSLPIHEKLDVDAVSYSSLPAARSLFARLVLLEGAIVQSPVFPCRALSYQTFLLACSDPQCHLDVIGTTTKESGLFMYQYQTI